MYIKPKHFQYQLKCIYIGILLEKRYFKKKKFTEENISKIVYLS